MATTDTTNIPRDAYRVNATAYEHWVNNRQRGYGSFHTALLQAYYLADAGNRARLEQVFPEWFVEKFEL